MARSEHWCFTHFDTTAANRTRLTLLPTTNSKVEYIIFGAETCPTTEKLHLQGYVQFDGAKERSMVKRILGCHVTPCNGSDQDNYDYCTKEDKHFIEKGTRRTIPAKKRKKGDDYSEIIKEIEAGVPKIDIIRKYPEIYMKCHTGIDKCFKSLNTKLPHIYEGPFTFSIDPDWNYVQVWIGPTTIGKTQYAKTLITNPFLTRHMDKLKQYVPTFHGGIIFDDVQVTHWPETSQIHLTDMVDAAEVNVKHSMVELPPGTKRIFTCNPNRYPFSQDPAIRRRLQVWKFKKTSQFPLGQFFLQ